MSVTEDLDLLIRKGNDSAVRIVLGELVKVMV